MTLLKLMAALPVVLEMDLNWHYQYNPHPGWMHMHAVVVIPSPCEASPKGIVWERGTASPLIYTPAG